MKTGIVKEGLKLLGIAVVCCIVFTVIFALVVHFRISIGFVWVGLVMFTGLLGYAIVSVSPERWRQPVFWCAVIVYLGCHVAIFSRVLRAYPAFKLVWWVPIVILEAGVFGVVVSIMPAPKHRRS